MKQHLIAAVTVIVLALGALGLYKYFLEPRLSASPRDFQTLHVMETEGVANFQITDLDGKKMELAQFKNKVVILNFWASWCAPCIEEVPSLIKLVKEFKGDVQLIAISGDSSREDIDIFLKSFPELKSANIYLVWDQDRSLMKKFEVARLPESLVLDGKHKLAKKIVGTTNWYTPQSIEYIKTLGSM